MKILAIDTSSKYLCLGLYEDGRFYEYNLELGRKLSSLLVPSIKRLLDALGWEAADIDYFACGLGPGSFTAMRIGLAAVKAFSWSLGKPLVGVSSLDIIAAGIADTSRFIIPVVDAKRNMLYCSFYKITRGQMKRVSGYMLLTEEEFLKKAKSNSIITGDGLILYKEKILANIKGVLILDKDYWYPMARNLIKLALVKIRRKQFYSPFKVKPIYIYPKECQIKSK